jgi:hypothetical protein
MTPSQIATVVSILNTNNVAVCRAMVILLSFQTEGERATSSTVESNGVGFSGATDKNGTYFAKWVLGLPQNTNSRHMGAAIDRFLKSNEPGRALTGKFLVRAREIALCHRKQLASLLPTAPRGWSEVETSTEEAPVTRRYFQDERAALGI